MEDPSDDFERLRDYVDARDCMTLSSFAPDKVKIGFTNEMEDEAKKKLKMTTVRNTMACLLLVISK